MSWIDMDKEELIKVISKGYSVALDNGVDQRGMYAKGFLDGMRFQKNGEIPKTEIDILIESLKLKDKLC